MAALILVVDDDFHITDQVSALLEAAGYSVAVAADGEEALRAVKKQVPALILLDIMLPRLDGYQVLESLRSDPKTKGIPVVVLSAKDVVSDVEKAYDRGATDYLAKPYHADRLLMKVKRHLGAVPK